MLQLTQSRKVMHHGKQLHLDTMDSVQKTHQNGCFRHMNSVHETLVSFYTSNLRQEISWTRLIMFHIVNLTLMVTVYGRT